MYDPPTSSCSFNTHRFKIKAILSYLILPYLILSYLILSYRCLSFNRTWDLIKIWDTVFKTLNKFHFWNSCIGKWLLAWLNQYTGCSVETIFIKLMYIKGGSQNIFTHFKLITLTLQRIELQTKAHEMCNESYYDAFYLGYSPHIPITD